MRINRYLSDCGYCSRREADRLITQGRVSIDGKPAILGDQIEESQMVCVDGIAIAKRQENILLAFHKPRGIVCTTAKCEKNNIIDYMRYPTRIYPVGRLDKDSEGLILMTNQGDIVNRIIRGRNAHEREYIVTVTPSIQKGFLRQMENGIPILDTVTRPCATEQIDANTFRIILTQGLNRQIRRMCEYCGYEVTRLQRIRIMNIRLGQLPAGKWRDVTSAERQQLYELIQNSSNNATRQSVGK